MKTFRRLLPVLILILALILLLAPARDSSSTALPAATEAAAGTETQANTGGQSGAPDIELRGESDADASGELQLLEPADGAPSPAVQPDGQDSAADAASTQAAGAGPEQADSPAAQVPPKADAKPDEPEPTPIPEDGSYTTKEDVALYLVTYGHLPPNFVTKAEAEKAGWTGGSLEAVLPGRCIGGDRFGNHEGLLPKAKGRTWRECDINTLGRRSRGAERLVYSSDGLIYYTPDHYETYERLY